MFRSVRDNVGVYGAPWNHGANPDLEPRDMEAKAALLQVQEETQGLIAKVVKHRIETPALIEQLVKRFY